MEQRIWDILYMVFRKEIKRNPLTKKKGIKIKYHNTERIQIEMEKSMLAIIECDSEDSVLQSFWFNEGVGNSIQNRFMDVLKDVLEKTNQSVLIKHIKEVGDFKSEIDYMFVGKNEQLENMFQMLNTFIKNNTKIDFEFFYEQNGLNFVIKEEKETRETPVTLLYNEEDVSRFINRKKQVYKTCILLENKLRKEIQEMIPEIPYTEEDGFAFSFGNYHIHCTTHTFLKKPVYEFSGFHLDPEIIMDVNDIKTKYTKAKTKIKKAFKHAIYYDELYKSLKVELAAHKPFHANTCIHLSEGNAMKITSERTNGMYNNDSLKNKGEIRNIRLFLSPSGIPGNFFYVFLIKRNEVEKWCPNDELKAYTIPEIEEHVLKVIRNIFHTERMKTLFESKSKASV